MSKLDDNFTVESLSTALDRLIDGHFDVIAERPRISTGADRIELDLFLRDKEKHLSAAGRNVLSGRYTFSPFLERQIPKDGTKEMRTISIASIRDAVVQRVLYDYLYPFVEATLSERVVFGYRKGVSAHDAISVIKRHFNNGLTFVFEADLEKFFDNVNHDVLLEKISALEIDERVFKLILRFLKTGKIPSEQVEEHRANKGKQKKFSPEARTIGVPQGGVLSGLLSNLYLAEFDAALLKEHCGLVRYADDFLVCCSSEDECRNAHSLAREVLVPLKVSLHPSPKKTKQCVHAESGVEFLGFRISPDSVRVRGRNIGKFKDRVKKVIATQKHDGDDNEFRPVHRRCLPDGSLVMPHRLDADSALGNSRSLVCSRHRAFVSRTAQLGSSVLACFSTPSATTRLPKTQATVPRPGQVVSPTCQNPRPN